MCCFAQVFCTCSLLGQTNTMNCRQNSDGAEYPPYPQAPALRSAFVRQANLFSKMWVDPDYDALAWSNRLGHNSQEPR